MPNEKGQPKQLVIFINPTPNGTMGDRFRLFCRHIKKRHEALEAETAVIAICSNKDGSIYTQSINPNDKWEFDCKNQQTLMKHQINFMNLQKICSPLRVDNGLYDNILIIGAAHPLNVKDPNFPFPYMHYANINGISDIPGLSREINAINEEYLSEGGFIRVQICHAGVVRLQNSEESSFIQAICPTNKECRVSAPNSFSIITDDNSQCKVMDVQTSTKNFKIMSRMMKSKLSEDNFFDIDMEVRNHLYKHFRLNPIDNVFVVYPNGSTYQVTLHENQPHSNNYNEKESYVHSLSLDGIDLNKLDEPHEHFEEVQKSVQQIGVNMI